MKAAALVPYAKDLLRDWDEIRSLEENLTEHRRSGVFGRASAGRADEILHALRGRYLDDADVRSGLVRLVRTRPEPPTAELVLGYHAALADPLIFDFAADFLFGLRTRGLKSVTVEDGVGFLRKLGLVGDGASCWSERTAEEVARKLLTAWRDFGVLEGESRKRIGSPKVPLTSFVWVATHRRRIAPGAPQLCEDRAFKLFLLTPEEVETLFRAADSRGLLDFHGGGLTSRVDWRYRTLEALANALA